MQRTFWARFVLLCVAAFAQARTTIAAPDVLVVCPVEFRDALREWEAYREAQGYRIAVIDRPSSAAELRRSISGFAGKDKLKAIVLVGDAPSIFAAKGRVSSSGEKEPGPKTTIPTNYVAGKINIRWGSEPEIASDIPYADLDGDDVPDVAIGRIPAHSAQELAAVVRKVVHYEQQTDHGAWDKCLNVVCCPGGFGAVTDAMVEAAGRQVFQQTVPAEYDVRQTAADTTAGSGGPQLDFGLRARRALSMGCLAWIYLGHGLPTELVWATPNGAKPILSSRDASQVRCGPHLPLAVLIACYTGAIDGPGGCLAEDLLISEQGPVAVIAATRVTMPYGNTVFGYELLRACFQDQPAALGDVVRLAEQRTLAPTANDQLRATLDGMADLLSPGPADLATERREHVLMYHLIGDPLLRLHRPATRVVRATVTSNVAK